MTDNSYDEDEVKAQMKEQVDGDFEDAVEEDADEGIKGEFRVGEDELSIIRAGLATEFPEDYMYLSDAYLRSVASKPYSKDPTKRRPLEYSQEKLSHVMQWRRRIIEAMTWEDGLALAAEEEAAAG